MKRLAILLCALACGFFLTAGSTFKFGYQPKNPETGIRISGAASISILDFVFDGGSALTGVGGYLDLTDFTNLVSFQWAEGGMGSSESDGFTRLNAASLSLLLGITMYSGNTAGPCGPMTNLDISGCTSLAYLTVPSNSLKSVDCSDMASYADIDIYPAPSLTNIVLPAEPGYLAVYDAALSSLDIGPYTNLLTAVDLHNNMLSQAVVDDILCDLDAGGLTLGYVDLSGNTAPSGTGTTCGSNLTAKSWTVSYDSP